MTSFVAILGAAGLAVGMALSGTLQNFAGGVMILIFKPFKVGDVIDAQGYVGTVNEIQIFNTIVKTPDNQVVILPNGKLSNSAMKNITREDNRRTEWVFGIAYGAKLLTPIMQTPRHWRILDALIASIMFVIAFNLASQGGWF